MFEKLQMEVLKKAAKLDSSNNPVSRPGSKFPYRYGYTDSGDLAIFTAYYACIIPKPLIYINVESVFYNITPAESKFIMRITNDEETKPAVLTSDLHKSGDILTNVFEVDGGERVYVDTKLLKPFNDLKIPLTFRGSSSKSPIFIYDEGGFEKLGLVLPVWIRN